MTRRTGRHASSHHAEIQSLILTPVTRHPAAFFRGITFEQALPLALSLAPLFVVTVRSWSSALLIIGALLSVVALLRPARPPVPDVQPPNPLKHLMVLALLLPVVAIAISSVLRSDHAWANYDAPARFLIAIPVFLLALRVRANAAGILQYIAPISLMLTLLHQLFMPQPQLWGAERMSTYFADPLVFGYVSLTLGLISAASIHLLKHDSKAVVLLKLAGLLIGLYLSAHSGSRTGWLAIPVILGLWLYRQSAQRSTHRALWGVGLGIALLLGGLFLPASVVQRVTLAFHEISTYNWVGMAPETSVGLRITFLRIAADLFASNPLMGFGDTRHPLTLIPSHIHTYATPMSLDMALTSGFHNELVTNAIRSGVAGLLSSLLLFLAPLYVFSTRLKAACQTQRAHAWLGLVWMLCVFISSFSTEVFDLKYTASFHALMIALLAAGALTPRPSSPTPSP